MSASAENQQDSRPVTPQGRSSRFNNPVGRNNPEDLDPDYAEFVEDNNDFETTPSLRAYRNSVELIEFTEKDRKRASDAAPNGKSCLIRGLPGQCGIEFAHCLPRALMRDRDLVIASRLLPPIAANIAIFGSKMSSIEYNWSLGGTQLNLDTRRNVICLDAILHTLHDQSRGGSWMLLPTDDVIDRYYTAMKSSLEDPESVRPYPIPDRGYRAEQGEFFQYRLVVINKVVMQHTIITTLQNINLTQPLTPDNARHYYYPYHDLPLFTSHLHPRFAILTAGLKLNRIGLRQRTELIAQYPGLSKVRDICEAWLEPPPPKDSTTESSRGDDPGNDKKPPRDNPDEGSEDNRSNHTRTTPYKTRSQTKKRARTDSGNGSPGGNKSLNALYTQRRLNVDGDGSSSCLSTETLVEHEVCIRKDVWGLTSIKEWVENFSNQTVAAMAELNI